MQTLELGATLQGGNYSILKMLGQGGFGITYLAEQTKLRRKVAIKEFFIKQFSDRDESTTAVTFGSKGAQELVDRMRDKFVKEARNLAKLKHPNIVKVIDIFEENNTAYYVMEFAERGSLADVVKRQGYMSEPQALEYVRQVASALAYLHERRMNHLDVKPGNIMLNEEGQAVLIDFGLSKQYDSNGVQDSTSPVGVSEGYAPLEQYKLGGVREFSPETDIYALGATLFKLLTGQTPPDASNVNEEGVPVNELTARGISQPTIDLICRAMEPRKKDRPSDVHIFMEEPAAAALVDDDDDESTHIAGGQKKPGRQPRVSVQPAASSGGDATVINVPGASTGDDIGQKAKGAVSGIVRILKYVAIGLGCFFAFLLIVGFFFFKDDEPVVTDTIEQVQGSQAGEVTEKSISLTHGHESKRHFTYTGPVNEDGLPHGDGTASYPATKDCSAATFTGSFRKGMLHNGELKFSSGVRYVGEFDEDGFYTYGTLWDKDGYYYKGTFIGGQPHNGTWYTPSGEESSIVSNGK